MLSQLLLDIEDLSVRRQVFFLSIPTANATPARKNAACNPAEIAPGRTNITQNTKTPLQSLLTCGPDLTCCS